MRYAEKGMFAILVVGLALGIALVAAGGRAEAKKPPTPPPDPEPSLTNPALVYGDGSSLMLVNSDGTATEGIASGGRATVRHAAWTSDGTRIGYHLVVRKKNFITSRVFYTVKPDGTDVTEVMSSSDWEAFQWFLDSTRVFARNTIIDLATGERQFVDLKSANHGNLDAVANGQLGPDLDPDTAGYQGWIAYHVRPYPMNDENPSDIWVAELETLSDGTVSPVSGSFSRLTLPGYQSLPTWSPDGGALAFFDDANDAGGKELKVVSVTLGTTAAFGEPSLVKKSSTGGFQQRPAWSPDSSWLAINWITDPGSEPGDSKGDIYRIRPDGTGLANLTNDDAAENAPHWNPNWTNDLED